MKTHKIKVLFIIVLVILFSVYIYFNYYSSMNLLSIGEKYEFLGLNRQNAYGFYGNEKLEGGLEFNWTEKEALKRVEVKGDKMVIPIFSLKPDMEREAVEVKIFFDNKTADEIILRDNNVRYLRYDIIDMGYKMGEFLDVKFKVDEMWSPADYNLSEDTRKLGIGVGNITFIR